MGFVNAKNKVPDQQKFYQAAYRGHQRIWQINPRSKYLLTPFTILMWTNFAVCMYGMGRRVAGYNSFFGKE